MTTARRYGTLGLVLAVLVVAVLGLLRAVIPAGQPTLDEQVAAVGATLRCPTCAGLSVKDSQSVLANGSRTVIADQLAEGRTPDQVRQYFVDRYGEQVLLSPDPSGPGLLVWLVPAVAIPVLGVSGWRWVTRARRSAAGRPDAAAVDDARTALAAFRTGRLDPDDSPAGELLREALLVRLAVEEDETPDVEAVCRADLRLVPAYRRWNARDTTLRVRMPGRAVPRRVVTLGAAVLVVVTAGAGLTMGLRDRGAAAVATGDAPVGPSAGTVVDSEQLLAATRTSPQDAAAWVALGHGYDREKRFPEALEAYGRALELQPGADDVALLRANVLVRAGSPAEALPSLQELAGRYPDDADVLLVLGLAQRGTGAAEAAATLRRFLELAPDSPAAPGVRDLVDEK